MRKCLKVLYLTSKLPYPPTDGGRIVVWETIKRLAERGHHVTLCCFGSETDQQSITRLEQFCRVILVQHDTSNRLIPALLNTFLPIPYTISKYYSKKMIEAVSSVLASCRFDLVQIEPLHMAHYLHIAKKFGVPVILREHNVESLLIERFSRKARGLQRFYARLQVPKVRWYESKMCEQADLCLTISEEDAKRLRSLNYRIRTVVIPAGVDTNYFYPKFGEAEEPYTIVSVASMDWPPNVDGIMWFCDKIFSKVKDHLPQVKLYIVGKNPPYSVRNLHNGSDIIVTGFVEDVRDYIAKGSVFIVPLRIGSGMRLKILQVMAMGKAVISTSVGAEGIRVNSGHNIVLADTETQFAKSVIELLTDDCKRTWIGKNARKLVECYYSWDSVIDSLERVYYELVGGK